MRRFFTKPDTYGVDSLRTLDPVNGKTVTIILTANNVPDWNEGITLSKELAVRLRDSLNYALEN